MEVNVTPVSQKHARKKGKTPELWKRNVERKDRYQPKDLPRRPSCNHEKTLQCKKLLLNDLLKFHQAFYNTTNKLKQDALILKCCTAVTVKRRYRGPVTRKGRDFTIKYKIYSRSQKRLIPVCQKTFLQCLNITKYRVQYVMSNFFHKGLGPVENRGGNHKAHLYDQKRQAVHEFLDDLKCSEGHYCRGSTQLRKYLSSELSINKLYKMFVVKTNQTAIKKSYFRNVFNMDYNLGFGTPRTDVCSTCLQLTEKLKTETDTAKKNDLMITSRVHRLRAKAFYEMLREKKSELKTISFDCQKNLPLPKVPDQSCYYSRQLYLYNSTVVEGCSKDNLDKSNVFAYIWTEDLHNKGSNEIASIVYDRLNKTDLTNIMHIRLMADGCAGQNKNTIILGMLSKWLLINQTIKTLEVVFPVTGHSFMPADRVFGNIEKTIRKMELIIRPEEYVDIIKDHATVTELRTINVYDWKTACQTVLKTPAQLHFKITQCKRFVIKRSKRVGNVLIKGEPFYKSDTGTFKNVCKKNMTTSYINPTVINPGLVNVKAAKLKDVNNLLGKHYGEDWKNLPLLDYYASIVSIESLENADDSFQTHEDLSCERQEEPPALIV